ncbi:MAG: hypothetical protein HY594_04410, partial [Candidatus Omnitrophica bacterium]|nr:hypothetical protein [Candidatus Omnitrophota bacterium]
MQTLQVSPKGWRWYLTGHPWIYRSDLAKTPTEGKGEAVRVAGPTGQFLGQYFYNPASKIALRLIRRDESPIDRNFWSARLARAIARRKNITDSTAYRLVSSEADGFPGLIVDRYADVLVLQSLCLGMDNLLPLMLELLREQMAPRSIVARNDAAVRSLEGLPQEIALFFGEEPAAVEILQGTCRFKVDVI